LGEEPDPAGQPAPTGDRTDVTAQWCRDGPSVTSRLSRLRLPSGRRPQGLTQSLS